VREKQVNGLDKEQSNSISEELENEFTDADVALDVTSETELPEEDAQAAQEKEDFQKKYQAVFDENAPAEKPKKRIQVADSDGFAAGLYDWIKCVIWAIAIVVVCLTFVFRLVEVDGESMLDTLQNADKVVVTNLFYEPHNSDIIVISHATNYDKPIIKRVIATEGQVVRLDYDNEKIYVDGTELTEPYIRETTFSGNGNKDDIYLPTDAEGNFKIPEGKLFVLGDNRKVSLDSRSPKIGLIDVNDVIGKAQFVVFPFNRFGNVYDK
jgi:signal peptidase I